MNAPLPPRGRRAVWSVGPFLNAMNVLVYSGPETIQTSLNHALTSLRTILVPNYTVQSITQQALISQPWQKSCALLVLLQSQRPGFTSVASKHIKNFVEGGGSCLILGSGACAASRSVGLGLGSTGLSLGSEAEETPLRFFDKVNNCYITFDEDVSPVQSRITSLKLSTGSIVEGIYDTETSPLKGFDQIKGVSVLARLTEEGEPIAGLTAGVNRGCIAIWRSCIQYPLDQEPSSTLLSTTANVAADQIQGFDKARQDLLKMTLTKLSLQVPDNEESKATTSRPLPQFLTSNPMKPSITSRIADAIAAPQSGAQLSTLKDANDEFHFHPLEESSEIIQKVKHDYYPSSDPSTWQPKHIIICKNGTLPSQDLTPLFNLDLYYKTLDTMCKKQGLPDSADSWGMGEALLYGEAVTSTQTMLDKNTHLLSNIPTPLLSLASFQLAGRGRGSNVWLSPAGCLQFSLLLRVSLNDLPGSKLVFLQYLFALAVVEACRDELVLGPKSGDKIRLKWPNDIYASVGFEQKDYRKVGGVLVNTSFSGGKVDIVVGCGLNVLNLPPITSLSQLQPAARSSLSMERTAASIMSKFEPMWTTFLTGHGSFQPFVDLYLQRWLHSDQAVTLTTTNPPTPVRIVGITPDYGLLRTIRDRSGLSRPSSGDDDFIDLQPDGNSFDLMANLIKAKS